MIGKHYKILNLVECTKLDSINKGNREISSTTGFEDIVHRSHITFWPVTRDRM